MDDVTLVSINWNQQKALELMLKSFVRYHYDNEPLKLMLIDNGSIDGSKQCLNDNKVPFISLANNIGHEQAINSIYDKINTKYALIVDTDVEFLGNVYQKYMPLLNDRCKAVGDFITGNQLNEPVKNRIGAWFFLFDIQIMKDKGINVFRDSDDWSYDVGSWMTEKILENGYTIHHLPRLNKNIDSDLLGMQYGSHIHFGKVSWDLEKHKDREYEVCLRRNYIKKRLEEEYANVDLKNKFLIYEKAKQ